MFDRQSLHIALLVWGCIFSLLAALCMFMGRNFEKEKKRWMILMQLSCAVLLLNDALAWGFRGGQGTVAYYMVRISNFIVVSMVSYIALPFVGGVVQTFYYGVSLINIAISISMILMFIVAMVEQNQMLAMREKEAADIVDVVPDSSSFYL